MRVEKSEASLVQDSRGKDMNPLRREAERFVFEIQAKVGVDCGVVPRLRVPGEAHKCAVFAAEVVVAANEPGVLSHRDAESVTIREVQRIALLKLLRREVRQQVLGSRVDSVGLSIGN